MSQINYKFALLGDSAVGKTAIFKKLFTEQFVEASIQTIGIDKRTFNFNDLEFEIKGQKIKKSFEVSIFDTAGQDRYRSIAKNYIIGSDGIILIYDITERKSFDHIETWLDSIKDVLSDWKLSDYLILLLGNKKDLVDDGSHDRAILESEAKKKCDDSELIWGGECSAKKFTKAQFFEIIENFTRALYNKVGEKKKLNNIQKKLEIIKKRVPVANYYNLTQ